MRVYINKTRSLRDKTAVDPSGQRSGRTMIQITPSSGKGALKTKPVVLLRGCAKVELQADCPSTEIQGTWRYELLEGAKLIAPLIPAAVGTSWQITTNMVGLVKFTYTPNTPQIVSQSPMTTSPQSSQFSGADLESAPRRGQVTIGRKPLNQSTTSGAQKTVNLSTTQRLQSREEIAYILFIDVRVEHIPTEIIVGQNQIKHNREAPDGIDVSCTFGCKWGVKLQGAKYAWDYNGITIGIIQNVHQQSWESASNQTFHGIYKCGEREGLLYEPVPKPTSPYVDAEVDVNTFPFMIGSHVSVSPITGDSRTVVLNDTPGVALPYFYDPANPKGRHNDVVEYSFEAKLGNNLYKLVGIGGNVRFVSCFTAVSSDAPHTYVGFAQTVWVQELNAHSNEKPESRNKGALFHQNLSPQRGLNGIRLVDFTISNPPKDVRKLGMETFGPGATEAADEEPGEWETYVWVSKLARRRSF